LSRKFGEPARIIKPNRQGFTDGAIVTWGKVILEPLDNDSISPPQVLTHSPAIPTAGRLLKGSNSQHSEPGVVVQSSRHTVRAETIIGGPTAEGVSEGTSRKTTTRDSPGIFETSLFIVRDLTRVGLVVGIVVGFLYVDHAYRPLLPDTVYCVLGAGREIRTPGTIQPNSWSLKGDCNSSDPNCATSWRVDPPDEYCVHKSLWSGWTDKLSTRTQTLPASR
jgi:hypothetical protein